MAASRKLQIEIERVLKKVQEGVEVFDSIWNKVYDTDNANQKEKFESELKKEIKKLQRYRDQIKTWLQSSDIKDKKALMDARKLIEKEMERFKICEKETKTKAFSKEGLGQQPRTDPKEKAKSETRDWLNNTVSELESQIDSFEAEMEGLSVKKGKARPPRLTHLESSITRHKAHIMKLELILRLLDNDELNPEQVNDIKDFLDDYIDRNQEDFDAFDDVDMLYITLPLDKVESLEDLVTIGPPGLVKGVGTTGSALSIKSALPTSSAQPPATVTSSIQQGDAVQEQADDMGPKNTSISSASLASAGAHSSPVKGILDSSTSSVSSSQINNAIKEEGIGQKPSPALPEAGLRNLGRSGVTNMPSITIPVTSGVAVSSSGSLGVSSEMSRRSMFGADERLGSSGHVPPLVSSISSRIILPTGGKTSDAVSDSDNGSNGEAGGLTSRVFPSSRVSGIQWRPGSPFQGQHEGVHRRPEIVPEQRENYLQRLQQVQGTLLGMPTLSGGNHKQFTSQQNPLLKQLSSQSSAASPQGAGLIAATSSQPKQSSILSQSSPHTIKPTDLKDTEVGHAKADEPKQHQNLSDDSSTNSVLDKNIVNEDESKVSYTAEIQAGVSASVTETDQVTRDTDLSPGQFLQPSQTASLGVIGRRSVSGLGAIGDNHSGLSLTMEPSHDQQSIMQLLESSFNKLPQPKDSERESYIPRHPAVTPQSYPQVQAPIVSNTSFWERLGSDNFGIDTLFFAFYYQQNTYQQYLAAKELKKQSWRYHKKYNTWFQRHEEPKVATDDYEQGTYVYFDFYMDNDERQQGWCQRIKTEFKFEYSFLEDELVA